MKLHPNTSNLLRALRNQGEAASNIFLALVLLHLDDFERFPRIAVFIGDL